MSLILQTTFSNAFFFIEVYSKWFNSQSLNIGSINGSLPSGTKPSHDPVMAQFYDATRYRKTTMG